MMQSPSYHHFSIMSPLDLNIQDHTSSSSSSYPILSDQLQPNDQEANIQSSGSWNSSTTENHESNKSTYKQKLKIRWKKEEISDEIEESGANSPKWMSSKMRIMRKIMVSDQTQNTINNNNHSNQIRVCSDCNTTKTPLWRSGPQGPKTLCNACGIRQRKARRAAAAMAAAAANGTTVGDHSVKKLLLEKKENKSKIDTHLKKKRKIEAEQQSEIRSKKEFVSFEELMLSLSQNLSVQQVFPQDEKEAAILLMALSYGGLVHG